MYRELCQMLVYTVLCWLIQQQLELQLCGAADRLCVICLNYLAGGSVHAVSALQIKFLYAQTRLWLHEVPYGRLYL